MTEKKADYTQIAAVYDQARAERLTPGGAGQ